MKLLSNSNSLHTVNMKEKIPKFMLFKRIVAIILIVIITGIVIQWGYNFYTNEKSASRMSYTRVNGKKMEYKVNGVGDYTVIFDGTTGATADEWNKVAKEVSDNLGVKTFVYNRRGYGENDGGSLQTPKDQAEDLKILLRKAAVSSPFILVGEGYGSLIITNFANLYPDSVAGVVLVNPYDEAKLNEKGEGVSGIADLVRKKIEAIGSNVSLTLLMDKIGLASNLKDFENNLSESEKEQFNYRKNQSNYRNAVYNETKNIYDRESNSQKDGMFKDLPFYIISNQDDNSLKRLGSSDLTFQYKSNYDGEVYSLMDSGSVENAIKKVIEISRKTQKSTTKDN
ncbi:alpha/beta fold hydrolase [Clostridium sp. Ade.TY]|uniref:alpha/beta fold hydrolase n=1 Tax=Clostridium sp. Ade.TY TaxID=1391647 RepID=UPI00040638E6|nr:alpha/beta fold hydrolase [Clostridium sp. Ade.TY]